MESELEELRNERRQVEGAEEREALGLRISETEERLNEALADVLDEILPEAFATVKEACRRLVGTEVMVTGQTLTWDMVPYDVQLLGGMALHGGKVAEMATGEGKTLVATMPLYLNALTGRGAHLVTVNSYLAQRDSEWMGHLYRYLGLTVDCIDLHEPGSPSRRNAYHADITYGTNNEFGFDYLRDNMVHSLEQRVQRPHYYAIIDEVDSVLIDEARTPLIISGPVSSETNMAYGRYNAMVADLARRQSRIIGEFIAEAERALAEGDEVNAGEKLLLARRGGPKNRRLAKLLSDDPSIQKLIGRAEASYMREKRLHELDELMLFAMDEKGRDVYLTDQGLDILSPEDPDAFVVPDLSEAIHRIDENPDLTTEQRREMRATLERDYAEKSEKIHVILQLLKAYTLYHKDEQYVVQDGQIVIVDEFTGRMMAGRRWSDGLHQAVEAKEQVDVKGETQTLATVTIQNYFRMYEKLAGMTGTAETEEGEFHQIYGLDVMVVPTNRGIVRDDRDDLVFRTKREKYNAIIDEIERLNALQLPVLVGTVSVDVSETLSRMLKRRGIRHEVLNAKYHGREAQIVADAGQPGAVTIATNMAGRGTDIKLGGGVREARETVFEGETIEEIGGLHIIGSERHESRRIDRQLRGRAGRQGDPGSSQFFLSLEDDLMRLFNSERIAGVMTKMGAEEGEVITHPLITRSIGGAQKRVELQNFEARKRLLDYDDVMNQQREVIYDLRTFALEGGEDLKAEAWDMIQKTLDRIVDEHVSGAAHAEDWDLAGLRQRLLLDFFLSADFLPTSEDDRRGFNSTEDVREALENLAREKFRAQIEQFGPHAESLLRYILLGTIDERWKDHLYDLDHLKASIGFRGWGQKDPLIEYKKEAYEMFVDLLTDIQSSAARMLFRARVEVNPPSMMQPQPSVIPVPRAVAPPEAPAAPSPAEGLAPPRSPEVDAALALGVSPRSRVRQPNVSELTTNRESETRKAQPAAEKIVGRNDPCPCGSGKKFKQCHGRQ
ncbi:MAG: preprotein translocase subunit SecA [Gemmatimonadota bacterium]|nr:preprotein translocase subunit SecA [Gemmatimonadota bacterium]